MYKPSEIMFYLIRAEVCGEKLPKDVADVINADTLVGLYSVSKPQDMTHIVAAALSSSGLLPDGELKNAFLKEQMTAVFRHAQIRHELGRICVALDNAGIKYIPLKGSVIRKYYPKPELRTSCDIDVYVAREDIDAAAKVFCDKLGYSLDVRSTHDVSFYSPGKTHVELHFDLVEIDSARELFSRVWDMSSPDSESSLRYVMDNELFVAHIITHMAGHFLTGGCGVRPFLDLWIARHRMGFDRERALLLLDECGLKVFAERAMQLAEIWFSGETHDDLSLEMADYILNAPLYGELSNKVAIRQAKRGGKFGYIISRIFLPYSKLKKIYPRLEKYPILLPFYQVKRWCRFFFRGGASRAASEIKVNNTVSEEKIEKLVSMCNSLGLNVK